MHLISHFVNNCSSSILIKMNVGEAKDISTSIKQVLWQFRQYFKGNEDLIKNYLSPQSFCDETWELFNKQ